MEFWLNLLFGNAIGLSSMIVIFGALLMICAMGGFFVFQAMKAPKA